MKKLKPIDVDDTGVPKATEERDLNDDLCWLDDTLLVGIGACFVSSPEPQLGTSAWAILPFRGTIRRLVPTTSRAGAAAFRNQHDAMPLTRRIAGHLTQYVARTTALRFAPTVYAPTELVFEDRDQSVIARASHELGRSVASCAITLGPRRYNRKPVVQLIDGSGNTVGFLKVGANVPTSSMVATEADAIGQLAPSTSPVLETPKLLWQADWHGRHVACFSPVGQSRHRPSAASPSHLARVAAAVVEAGGGPIGTTLGEAAALVRLEAEARMCGRQDLVSQVDYLTTSLGNRPITVGLWHGDFSPWNMVTTTSRGTASTSLIDWEFSSDAMPVGADLLHHRVMVATHLRNQASEKPIADLLQSAGSIPELDALAIPSSAQRAHLALYLTELIRRDLELGRLGLQLTGFGQPAIRALDLIITAAS